ncbi:MAG: CocE/NonD family hydrolase [Microthrixaceae bacterium]
MRSRSGGRNTARNRGSTARAGARGRRHLALLAATVALALVGAACTQDVGSQAERNAAESPTSSSSTTTTRPDLPRLDPDAKDAAFTVRGSVNQVSVLGAEKGERLALYGDDGVAVAQGTADDQGSYLFRLVAAGDGYRVAGVGDTPAASGEVAVVDAGGSTPPQSFYDGQQLQPGYQYIATRDGTTLAASVYLPGPPEKGPYPTVVEYSGYDPAKPASNLIAANADKLKGVVGDNPEALCGLVPFACNAPAQPGSLLASAMGFAVVAVNIRGTGCSGGAYDFFEPLQLLDGYDVIETVAAQPWVKGGKVGMVGLSYPGISQLFVASTQPPHLAAITPLSVYDDTVRGVLAPGGIFNKGFALKWADEVLTKAKPYGQGWEKARVDGGDTTCAENQKLRGQNVDASAKALKYKYYDRTVADPLSPALFAKNIEVPVFLTGSYQDEQTGGRFPLLFDRFTNSPLTRFSAWNGAHADGFGPVNLVEWKTFLDLYVGDQLTLIGAPVKLFLPLVMQEIFGTQVSLPDQRFLDQPSPAAARAAYEKEAPIRLLFESGAGDPSNPGAPVPTAEARTTSFPPPGTTAQAWYFQPDGSLSTSKPPADGGASSFGVDQALGDLTTFDGSDGNNIFHADARYDWKQEPDGKATVFVSPPLEKDAVLAGTASADLWIRTDVPDTDLGVTLSEVRPDGKEVYIQSGFLRGSFRKPAKGSTDLLPLHTGYESDAEPLPKGEFTQARVEILPFAQIMRAGSRIRISVHTAGGDKPGWSWILTPNPPGTVVQVGHSEAHPSRVVLPVTSGLLSSYPAQLPACGALRGQPCRDYVPFTNAPAA